MASMRAPLTRSIVFVFIAALGGCGGGAPPVQTPPGADESTRTSLLEVGATALQTDAPADALDIYLVGFHPMKSDPSHQMEAHHFCRQVNEDFAQCALFDGNTAEANLTGVEYIISARLFAALPEEERAFWHPHNGEILSGQLVAPGLPEAAELELMRSKMNSYGKTWHVWDTGNHVEAGDRLPFGEPMLAWSFNRFGEAQDALVRARDERLNVDTEARRRARTGLVDLARPQSGVDALEDAFPGPTRPIPGVADAGAGP